MRGILAILVVLWIGIGALIAAVLTFMLNGPNEIGIPFVSIGLLLFVVALLIGTKLFLAARKQAAEDQVERNREATMKKYQDIKREVF